MANNSKGYGPTTRNHLIFNGDESEYELFKFKFLAYMRLQKLHTVFEGIEETTPNAAENADAFAELLQVLDDRSLSLIIRDAKDDGRKALLILREHYLGKIKPRIICLYTKLTSLKMNDGETRTDYIIRAENATEALKAAGEVISDGSLTAMILKGLPTNYKTFATVVSQKEKPTTFSELKVSLRAFEENEKVTCQKSDNNVMKFTTFNEKTYKYFTCNKPGHKAYQCKNKGKSDNNKKVRWCGNCKSYTHDSKFCRKSNYVKSINEDSKVSSETDASHSFAFKVNVTADNNCVDVCSNILVDTGATAHSINDEKMFVNFGKKFETEKHYIELENGSRTNSVVSGRGDAEIKL